MSLRPNLGQIDTTDRASVGHPFNESRKVSRTTGTTSRAGSTWVLRSFHLQETNVIKTAFKFTIPIMPSFAAKSKEYVKDQSSLQRILDCRCPARNPVNAVAPPIQVVDRLGREREHGPTPWLTTRRRDGTRQDRTMLLRHLSAWTTLALWPYVTTPLFNVQLEPRILSNPFDPKYLNT